MKKAFTLLELIISITLFMIIVVFLYKTLDQTKHSNNLFLNKEEILKKSNHLHNILFRRYCWSHPSTKKPLRTVTDARHAGKHAARLSCFCIARRASARLSSGRALRIRIAGADAETCQTPLDYLIYRQRQERQTEQGGHCGLPV